MAPAAAAPLITLVLSAQNGPRALVIPSEASEKAASVRVGEVARALSASPRAPTPNAPAKCQRRSPVRSEWAPFRSMAIAATRGGMAVAALMAPSLQPAARLLKISGSQRFAP